MQQNPELKLFSRTGWTPICIKIKMTYTQIMVENLEKVEDEMIGLKKFQ